VSVTIPLWFAWLFAILYAIVALNLLRKLAGNDYESPPKKPSRANDAISLVVSLCFFAAWMHFVL